MYLMSIDLVHSSSHRTTTAIDTRTLLEVLGFFELSHAFAGRLDQFDGEMNSAGRFQIDLVVVNG